MKLITEQEFLHPPYNGCQLRARIVAKCVEKPFYLIIDNEESLKERVVSFFKKNNMGSKDIVRIDYLFLPNIKQSYENNNP